MMKTTQEDNGVLVVEASEKLSNADYQDVLRPALEKTINEHGKLRVVIVFAAKFEGMDGGAFWQDLTMGVQEWSKWERVALVSDQAWMRDGLHLFGWAIPGKARAFGVAEREAAVAWAGADD
jgi:SpoIIAA-like